MLGHAEHSPVGATLGRGGGTNPPFPTKDEQPCTAWPEQVGVTSQPPCPSEPALQDAGATRPAPPNERAMDRSQGIQFDITIICNIIALTDLHNLIYGKMHFCNSLHKIFCVLDFRVISGILTDIYNDYNYLL